MTAFLLSLAFCSTIVAAQVDPAHEFIRGERQKFNSRNHAKAKGVELSMEFPRSWKALEGERPNILQKFVSESGKGLEMALITVKSLNLPLGTEPSNAELAELFSPEGLRDFVPAGAKVISAKRTKIDNLTAGRLAYIIRDERADMQMLQLVDSYLFYYGGNLIIVSFQVGGADRTGGTERLDASAQRFATLFRLMANSLIVHNQYR